MTNMEYNWQHGMAATNAHDRRDAESAQAAQEATELQRRMAWRKRRTNPKQEHA
jgi:hypothetical protein